MSEEGGRTRMVRRAGTGRGRTIEPPPPEKVERAADAVPLAPWDPSRSERAKVLFMVANSSTAPVNAEVEERKIQDVLDGGRFVFEKVPDVRAEDLFASIQERRPQVVHFSGHGHGKAGLAMKNRDGHPTTFTAYELGLTFKDLAAQGIAVRAVVLNACLADEQARAIAPYVDSVVGTSTLVGDDTAVTFAANFYRSITEGRGVRAAFEAARARCGGDVEGSERIFRLFYSEPAPPPELPPVAKSRSKGLALLAMLLIIAGAVAAAVFLPDDPQASAPDVGPADTAVAMPIVDAAPADVLAPDAAKPPPKPAPDAAPPDAAMVAPRPKIRRVVSTGRICARDLKAGRNRVISKASCCVGSIPASAAQQQSVKQDLGGCTSVMYCQSIAAGCR